MAFPNSYCWVVDREHITVTKIDCMVIVLFK